MILTIPMQLEATKKEVPVEFSKIQGSQFNIIKNNILENLNIRIHNESNFMWEQFDGNSNICGEFAWQYLSEFLSKKECYLFFNQIECRDAYLFRNGKDLCDVIGETYNCEVYVTDYQGTYIICYNHEMILTGCGRAKQWIDEQSKYELSKEISRP